MKLLIFIVAVLVALSLTVGLGNIQDLLQADISQGAAGDSGSTEESPSLNSFVTWTDESYEGSIGSIRMDSDTATLTVNLSGGFDSENVSEFESYLIKLGEFKAPKAGNYNLVFSLVEGSSENVLDDLQWGYNCSGEYSEFPCNVVKLEENETLSLYFTIYTGDPEGKAVELQGIYNLYLIDLDAEW